MTKRRRSVIAGAIFGAIAGALLLPGAVGLVYQLREQVTSAQPAPATFDFVAELTPDQLRTARLAGVLLGALLGGWFGSVQNMLAVRQRFFNAADPDTYPPRLYDLADPTDPINYDDWGFEDQPSSRAAAERARNERRQ